MELYRLPDGQAVLRVGKNAVPVLGLSVSQQYRMIKDKKLPQPIRISERRQVWTRAQLEEHFNRLADEQGVSHG